MSAHIQVTFEATSGIAEDRVVNTWAMQTGAPLEGAEPASVAAAFAAFYTATPATFSYPVAQYLSAGLSRVGTPHSVKVYDLTDAMEGGANMGSPVYTHLFGLPAFTGTAKALPSEVALAVTLEAVGWSGAAVESGSTRPQSRRRGRVYLGPLDQGALALSQTAEARPDGGFQSLIFAALADLRDDLAAIDAGFNIGVWSRTDGDVRSIVSASIDNAFDTQRRRGRDATGRTRVLL